jgi:hypothetical protein
VTARNERNTPIALHANGAQRVVLVDLPLLALGRRAQIAHHARRIGHRRPLLSLHGPATRHQLTNDRARTRRAVNSTLREPHRLHYFFALLAARSGGGGRAVLRGVCSPIVCACRSDVNARLSHARTSQLTESSNTPSDGRMPCQGARQWYATAHDSSVTSNMRDTTARASVTSSNGTRPVNITHKSAANAHHRTREYLPQQHAVRVHIDSCVVCAHVHTLVSICTRVHACIHAARCSNSGAVHLGACTTAIKHAHAVVLVSAHRLASCATSPTSRRSVARTQIRTGAPSSNAYERHIRAHTGTYVRDIISVA